MTLRRKTLFIIGATFYGVIILLFFISRNILLDSFVELETQNVLQNTERVLSTLSGEVSHLEATTGDWAAWDDTYAFIEDANTEYIESNLIDGTFIKLRLNLIMFIDSAGQTIFGKAFDLNNEEEVPVPQSLHRHLSLEDILLTHPDTESSISGIVLLPEGRDVERARPSAEAELIHAWFLRDIGGLQHLPVGWGDGNGGPRFRIEDPQVAVAPNNVLGLVARRRNGFHHLPVRRKWREPA